MIVCPIVYLYSLNNFSGIYFVFFAVTDCKAKEEISMGSKGERDSESSCPGLHPERLLNLMRGAIWRCQLDLSEMVVLTEAASDAWVVTPVLAAMAGAKQVFALTQTSRYGTIDEIARWTTDLARAAAVSDRIQIISEKRADIVVQADIVTNSGHVRPIDAKMVGWMKPTAVIPLMFEAWEFRSSDVDLTACNRLGISVAGTNERHPAVDVFSYLGMMAVKILEDARIPVHGSRVVVWCDNPFRPFLVKGLSLAGAVVESAESLEEIGEAFDADAILVALRPQAQPVVGSPEAAAIAHRYPTALVVQFWGDFDRTAMAHWGLPFWPLEPPPPGHQGILLSSLGPEPIVRLQSGGLKVGQLMAKVRISQIGRPASHKAAIAAAVASGFGQALPETAIGETQSRNFQYGEDQ